MSRIPKFVYKYQPIDIYSLRNLKNAQIYFNAPKNFNDPFEITLNKSLSETQYKIICDHYKAEYGKIRNFSYQEVNEALEKALKEQQKQLLTYRGCWCASIGDEKNLPINILMWSHYADSHKGMCLAFKRNSLEQTFGKEMKVVSYHDIPISLCPLCLISACNCSSIMTPLYNKSNIWDYEKEIRIFHKEPNKLYGYQVDALEAIYFGSEVYKADLENVCLIVQGQNKNIKFFQIFLKPNSYEVGFKLFNYKSYLDSKSNLG
jgi:hypothetical protein